MFTVKLYKLPDLLALLFDQLQKKDTHFLKSEESTSFIHFLNDSVDYFKKFSLIPSKKSIKSTQQRPDRRHY